MLEQHCTSLEQSKMLRELGFRKEPTFYWNVDGKKLAINTFNREVLYTMDDIKRKSYPAYLLDELMVHIPDEIPNKR